MTFNLHTGDCLEVMATMPENSVDTIITDPPYALTNRVADVQCCLDCGRVMGGRDGNGNVQTCPKCESENIGSRRSYVGAGFMGKDWDTGLVAFSPEIWREALRVAKPGAMLMAFGGTRTFHRLMVAIEDAGWEIRDTMSWLYGSGFPKSHQFHKSMNGQGEQWNGWGTALKPAWEPIILAMKPLDGTFANNAQTWGVAGLWVDGGRVPTNGGDYNHPGGHPGGVEPGKNGTMGKGWHGRMTQQPPNEIGRWPANLIHDGSAEVLEGFPVTGPSREAHRGRALSSNGTHDGWKRPAHEGYGSTVRGHDDSGGSAARFFYCAKASRSERNAGLEGMSKQNRDASRNASQPSMNGGGGNPYNRGAKPVTNHHPTVKPLALMRYLCKLTRTPTGGVVLDPFMGSGSTGCAAVLEGRDFIGIDLDPEYVEIARRRIEHWLENIEPVQKTLL